MVRGEQFHWHHAIRRLGSTPDLCLPQFLCQIIDKVPRRESKELPHQWDPPLQKCTNGAIPIESLKIILVNRAAIKIILNAYLIPCLSFACNPCWIVRSVCYQVEEWCEKNRQHCKRTYVFPAKHPVQMRPTPSHQFDVVREFFQSVNIANSNTLEKSWTIFTFRLFRSLSGNLTSQKAIISKV